MEPSSELLSVLAPQRQAVAHLEAELASRRQVEAKALVELELRVAALKAGVALAARRAREAEARSSTGSEELRVLQIGLTRSRRVWVRIFEPLLLAMAVIVPISVWGFTQHRYGAWQLAAGVAGILSARLVRGLRA